jgi:hypothetical protein
MASLANRVDIIRNCPASPRLKLRMLEMVVRPGTRYSLSLAVFSWPQIKRLNTVFNRTAKAACGLGRSSPNITQMRDNLEYGLGVDTLQLTYVEALTDCYEVPNTALLLVNNFTYV